MSDSTPCKHTATHAAYDPAYSAFVMYCRECGETLREGLPRLLACIPCHHNPNGDEWMGLKRGDFSKRTEEWK